MAVKTKPCKCLRCGHRWDSRLKGPGIPLACPKCKRYDWYVPISSKEEPLLTTQEQANILKKLEEI